MRIGVVSDTHSRAVPKQLLDDFQNVDLIIHAGDFCAKSDFKIFKKLQKVKAVFGNMDGLELRQMLPEKEIFEIDGVRFGLVHGYGSPNRVVDNVKEEFKREKVDVVIFGHSHYPFNEIIDGTLYFNPGSATDTVRAPYCSYGMITLDHGKVTGKIVKVEQ